MKKILVAATALLASAQASLAITTLPGPTPVPEISALEGMAAIAALAAVVMLVWERRRRAA